jgi:2-oxoacid:acceptor oxidoreductase delta subunit (pyruvate/2-ketoisovalerate family)
MIAETGQSRIILMPQTTLTTEGNKTGSWRYLRPRYEEKTSPCSAACPAGEDIATIEMLASQGAFKEAWETILRENPLPAVCGRVCFHPCEGRCNRREFDSAVAIHSLERFLSDSALRNGLAADIPRLPEKKQRIAVAGSGPAGLAAAYFLLCLGYRVDVFEAMPEAGGILRWGIPEYRLPGAALYSDIRRIELMGAKITTGHPVTEKFLEKAGRHYDAVFIGCGFSRSTRIRIEGENRILDGLAFLKQVRWGETPDVEGTSAVFGGGNTAIDVARTIRRLGGRAVILYRRRREDMPAFADEVDMAIEEGVELVELAAPLKIVPRSGGLLLAMQKMKISGQDRDGRGRIVPDGRDVIELEVQHVFNAAGSAAGEPWHEPQEGAKALSHCAVLAGKYPVPVVYGGDLTNSARTVVHAIASGKQAAMAIDVFLNEGPAWIDSRLARCAVGAGPGLSMEMYMEGPRKSRSPHVVEYAEINADYFSFARRMTQPRLLVEERRSSFDEIDLRISANIAIREAARCFNCGICNQCDNCHLFCPDVSVIRTRDMKDRHINYDYCKGCGLCAAECPRNAVTLEEEQ